MESTGEVKAVCLLPLEQFPAVVIKSKNVELYHGQGRSARLVMLLDMWHNHSF